VRVIPPTVMPLYLKLQRLILARKWTAAFAIADALDLALKDAP
jgi:hypothetical protein